jgi:peptidoglycan/LPS O-acetylase OafA/YrhL
MKKEHRIEVVKYLTRLTSINISSKNDKFSLLLLSFVDRHISSLNTHTWRLTSVHSFCMCVSLSLSSSFSFRQRRKKRKRTRLIVVLTIFLFLALLVIMMIIRQQWWWWQKNVYILKRFLVIYLRSRYDDRQQNKRD